MPKVILFIFESYKLKTMIDTTPLFTDDTIVFGLLMSAIALIFYTESRPTGFWHKFYINGLGEFLFTNNISPKNLFQFISQSENELQKIEFPVSEKALIPVG